MSAAKLLVYLVRRDLRVADNPILHHLATSKHEFTHLLPVFVLPPHQIEVSGFLAEGEESPYPPALSRVGKFWRCGPHRAKFLAQSIWDLKTSLESLESGLALRVGNFAEVVTNIVDSLSCSDNSVAAVWMTEEQSLEEEDDQKAISLACSTNNIDFKLWPDEKYYIDDRDTGLKNPQDLPDIFTTYRKTQEPLRDRPRASLPRPMVASLPPLPPSTWTPPQKLPFVMPNTYEELESRLLQPLKSVLSQPPVYPRNAKSAHPFKGGESQAWSRVFHLVQNGGMVFYQQTRNGLVGLDYSTKLSGYLATGCITARQIHEELLKLENGIDPAYALCMGFNRGENEGTKAVRFELLWRDYMRLCTKKFGSRLFQLSGFKGGDQYEKDWKTTDEKKAAADQDPPPARVQKILDRFLEGNTGMGLIDASQRELYHTGYTSNRARQNVANFLSKHLGIDWRYGAEWYESMLVDYDVSSNWANWQYVSGVGNDPRGDARIFNPVKQAFDYDNNGRFVRTWVPEVKHIEKLENVFQVWTTDKEELEKFGLLDDIMVTDPIKRIEFLVDRKPRASRRPHRWRRVLKDIRTPQALQAARNRTKEVLLWIQMSLQVQHLVVVQLVAEEFHGEVMREVGWLWVVEELIGGFHHPHTFHHSNLSTTVVSHSMASLIMGHRLTTGLNFTQALNSITVLSLTMALLPHITLSIIRTLIRHSSCLPIHQLLTLSNITST
ncbi:hypothetical protein QQZ08_008184 [Neonectria magnoliae]|uniref:Cryptochrome DASH n=1 Tax=Neonectria magnoliae TaxID=2732573 RepID=A0ABR1HWG0_9HYPO